MTAGLITQAERSRWLEVAALFGLPPEPLEEGSGSAAADVETHPPETVEAPPSPEPSLPEAPLTPAAEEILWQPDDQATSPRTLPMGATAGRFFARLPFRSQSPRARPHGAPTRETIPSGLFFTHKVPWSTQTGPDLRSLLEIATRDALGRANRFGQRRRSAAGAAAYFAQLPWTQRKTVQS